MILFGTPCKNFLQETNSPFLDQYFASSIMITKQRDRNVTNVKIIKKTEKFSFYLFLCIDMKHFIDFLLCQFISSLYPTPLTNLSGKSESLFLSL